jgi:membrane protein DedA with SNARE-associated domain
MINRLLDLYRNYVLVTGPFGIMFGTFVAVVVVFVPDEIILITAGSLLPDVKTLFLYTIFACIGGYLGGLVFYFIGYKSKEFAYNFVDKFGKWLLIDRKQVEYAEAEFTKRGNLLVFWGRFLPGIKSVISLPAGISRMNLLQYSVFTIIGVYVWYGILLSLGFIFRSEISIALDLMAKYDKIAYGIIILISIVFVTKYISEIQKKKNGGDSSQRI